MLGLVGIVAGESVIAGRGNKGNPWSSHTQLRVSHKHTRHECDRIANSHVGWK